MRALARAAASFGLWPVYAKSSAVVCGGLVTCRLASSSVAASGCPSALAARSATTPLAAVCRSEPMFRILSGVAPVANGFTEAARTVISLVATYLSAPESASAAPPSSPISTPATISAR